MGRNMRKALLLVTIGFGLCFGAVGAEAGVRDRDVETQRAIAAGRNADPAPSTNQAVDPQSNTNMLPGFVQPYGYPLPPYADGNNFGTMRIGR